MNTRLHEIPIVLINLEEREDRLRESLTEVETALDRKNDDNFFVLRPHIFLEDGGFINPAYRSCLDSHRRAAQMAFDKGWEEVLIFEDDIEFSSIWDTTGQQLLQSLDKQPWDIAVLGCFPRKKRSEAYLQERATDPLWIKSNEEIVGAHAYVLKKSFLPLWLDHLKTIADGTKGDDMQGPMGPDGALTTITWMHDDVNRILPFPNLVGQRSSLSNIHAGRLDNVPLLQPLLQKARVLKRLASRKRDFA